MARYIAYYRVSTERQGRSGLGLEAQQAAVAAFLAGNGGPPAAEFIEVESGARPIGRSSPGPWRLAGSMARCC